MIHAKELRISNLVSCQGKVIEVESIHDNGINLYTEEGLLFVSHRLDELEGIALTPEWLEKLGFIKIPEAKGEYFKASFNIRYSRGSYGLYKHIGSVFGFLTSVQYLHKLQNVFYYLTGHELTVKQEA